MLKVFNGLETLQISINPDDNNKVEYKRRCYKYSDDIESTRWLIEEIFDIEYANEVLEEAGFDSKQVEGFISLYGHRALVILKNKQNSSVLSVMGSNIIIYGETLSKY